MRLLGREIENLPHSVEVIVCDDHSDHLYGLIDIDFAGMEFRFIALDQNLGRSRIRNFLAEEAKYEHLIFIDAHCLPVNPFFIRRYQHIFSIDTVIVGGQLFAQKAPPNKNDMLRWVYGTQVESRSVADRKSNPYGSLMANNFSTSKTVLSQCPFDDQHTGYGHEDTLFGFQLRDQHIPIHHIDNCVRHLDIEPNAVFLSKTAQSVCNLAILYKQGKLNGHDIRLIHTYEIIRRLGLMIILGKWMMNYNKRLYQNLLLGSNNLTIFSLYKLSCLCAKSIGLAQNLFRESVGIYLKQ